MREMQVKEAGENYLETILILTNRNGSVRSIDIAHELNYSKPTISIAMRNLKDSGHITIDDDGHISLTAAGREIAEKIYERHNIIAKMFINIGVSEKQAYADACKIEHDISDETFACIKKHYLESHVK